MQNPLEIPIFQFASKFKIHIDSFLTAFTVLKNWMKSMAKNRGIYPFIFLAKIVTTEIWPSGVLDYWNKNDNWTVVPLSHISVMLQYYFFLHKYRLQWRKNKSFKEENNQNTKQAWLRCMSDHEWHDIARYSLVMPQNSMIKLYNIKSISHHYRTWCRKRDFIPI